MSTQPEKLIERQIINMLKICNFYVFKVNTVGIYDAKIQRYRKNRDINHIKGVADILGIGPDGRFIAIEVKTKTGKLTPEQKLFLSEINHRNGLGIVGRSIEEVARLMLPSYPDNQILKRYAEDYKPKPHRDH